ncbi:BrnT family toxin [Azohydromonas aeria]|uniref:BrnT family toxin n=1 Tax=Azohydromonas aeria TaxID=2590212 RepID=UPI0012F9CA74|nr:BrnT family toxin [Azohydromonas aeria]
MEIDYDPAKNERNIRERQLAFERVSDFDFETAVFSVDQRRDYGEVRWRALGMLDGRVHALVFVETQQGVRVISFRKANQREVKHYERAKTQPRSG